VRGPAREKGGAACAAAPPIDRNVGAPGGWLALHPPGSERERSEVDCKPGPVPTGGCPPAGGDHSSRRRIAASLERSNPGAGFHLSVACFGRAVLDSAPIRACSGRGLPRRRSPGCRAWALTPRFQPCLCLPPGRLSTPEDRRPSAVSFLLRFPSGHPGSPLATSLPCGARTFLPWTVLVHRRTPVHLRPSKATGTGVARPTPALKREPPGGAPLRRQLLTIH